MPSFDLPARRTAVVSRDLGTDIVVVDERTQQAHALTGPLARVWRATAGGSLVGVTQAEVDAAVAELLRLDLLDVRAGLSRRALLARGGAVALVAGAVTVGLPRAAAADSSNSTRSGFFYRVSNNDNGINQQPPTAGGQTGSFTATIPGTVEDGALLNVEASFKNLTAGATYFIDYRDVRQIGSFSVTSSGTATFTGQTTYRLGSANNGSSTGFQLDIYTGPNANYTSFEDESISTFVQF